MEWNKSLIEFWAENYYSLRDYELNPFESIRIFGRQLSISGSGYLSPYAETCDLNWEFDKALKKLGDKEELFKRIYIDGYGGSEPKLFNKFCKILMEDNNAEET